MNARDAMATDVATCGITESLEAAVRLMWEHRCGCLPVIDGEGRVSGILTDRDVAMASYTQRRPLSDIPVETAMSKVVHSCEPSTSLEDVRALMVAHHVRRLPVVDRGRKLRGLVSLTDIARVAATRNGEAVSELADVALTLAEVATDAIIDDQEPGRVGLLEVVRNSVEVLRSVRQELRADLGLASDRVYARLRSLEARLRGA